MLIHGLPVPFTYAPNLFGAGGPAESGDSNFDLPLLLILQSLINMSISQPRSNGIRILSLDGGDVRCISQLYLLKEYMHHLNWETQEVLPRDHFDVITAVDGAGPVAILLGVLGLSLKNAQAAYAEICTEVFPVGTCTPMERSQRLKLVMEKILTDCGFSPTTRLRESTAPNAGCKVSLGHLLASDPRTLNFFRNYDDIHGPSYNPTIVEAVRACWARKDLFPPIVLGEGWKKVELISAIDGFPDPTWYAVKEALDVYGASEKVACILSLGSGKMPRISLESDFWHQDLLRNPAPSTNLNQWQFGDVCYRFCVDELQTSEPATKKGMGTIESVTDTYLGTFTVTKGMESCVKASRRNADFSLQQLLSPKERISGPQTSIPDTSSGRRWRGAQNYILFLSGFMLVLAAIYGLTRIRTSGTRPEAHSSWKVGSLDYAGLPPLSPFFVPRDEPMRLIVEGLLGPKGKRQRIIVISGMGGSGKSQLAIQFANEYHMRFKFIIFIDASSPESIRAGFRSRTSGVDERFKGMTFEDILNAFAHPHNEFSPNWLIVLDNADSPKLTLSKFIPKCIHGSILITTRNPSLDTFAPQKLLSLGMMTPREATSALLSCFVGPETHFTAQQRDEALKIVNAVECLPIAIIQVGQYMRKHLRFEGFSKDLEAHRPLILKYPTQQLDGLRYSHGAHAAFNITLEDLSPRALQLLSVLSFLHYSDFPRAAFTFAALHDFKYEPEDFADRDPQYHESASLLKAILCPSGPCNEVEVDFLLDELYSSSLVTPVKIDKTVTLRFHPLSHEWAGYRIPTSDRPMFHAASVRLLACATDYEAEDLWKYLSPHVSQTLSSMKEMHANDLAYLSRIVRHNNQLPQLTQIWERIYEKISEVHNEADVRSTRAKAILGSAYGYNGDIQTMERMEREAVELRNNTSGPNTLETMDAVANLAHTVNFNKLDHDEAKAMWHDVLRVRRAEYPPNHILISFALYYLGQTYMFQGQYEEAVPQLKEALKIRQDVVPGGHPSTVNILEILAYCYDQLGSEGETKSEVLGRRNSILELRKNESRRSAPDILYAIHYFATSLMAQGRDQEAAERLKEVVHGRKKLYDDHDPRTLATMVLLGQALYNQRLYAAAAHTWQEALNGIRKSPHYFTWGFIPVKVRWRELLEIREPRHIRALNLMYNLGLALYSQRKYADAECLWRKALQAREELDDKDPDTAKVRWWLEDIQWRLEDVVRAQTSWLCKAALFLGGFWSSSSCPSRCLLVQDSPADLGTHSKGT